MATDAAPTNPDELFGIDALLSDEERAMVASSRVVYESRPDQRYRRVVAE
ncbi:hypothetical protein [Mycobacteroides abscessus]|nr:hypothetical protein [Mycobacteroides abscessus]